MCVWVKVVHVLRKFQRHVDFSGARFRERFSVYPPWEKELITAASRTQTRRSRDDVRYRPRPNACTDIDCIFRIARNATIIQSCEWHTTHTTHIHITHIHTQHVIARASAPRCLRCLMSGRRKWGALYRARVLTPSVVLIVVILRSRSLARKSGRLATTQTRASER